MDSCLLVYRDPSFFQQSFSAANTQFYMQQGREKMVTSPNVPSLNIASLTFGRSSVNLILRQHLFQLAGAMGVNATAESIDYISDDIISGYGDLKVTEIILALKMIREGRFRQGRDDSNRGQFYGQLSSSVICDCLHQFRYQYRNRVLEQYENEQRQLRRKAEESMPVTYEQRLKPIVDTVCRESNDPGKMESLLQFFKQYLKPQDMQELEQYIQQQQQQLAELSSLRKQVESLEHIKDAIIMMDSLPEDKKLRGIERLVQLATEYNQYYDPTAGSNSSVNR